MKWILAILLFIGGTAMGQSDDTDRYIWYKFQYGSRMPRFWADSILKAAGLVKFTGLSASIDTTTYKPVVIDDSGNVRKFTSWPGGGGTPGITQLTGPITAGPGSGSQVTSITDNSIQKSKLEQSPGLSILGNIGNTTDDVGNITAGNDGNILRRFGTSIGFGAINLASTNAVGSSILPILNGGTGTSFPALVAGTNISITGSWPNQTINATGGSIETVLVAYVDSAFGNNGTAQVNRPDKPFLTINAALDATAALSKRVIQIGAGTYASPDSVKIKSYTWFRGSGKPKPNWVVAVPSIDADTKTAPTKLVGGTILQGSFWFNAYRLQGIIISDLGVDVGSDWCTASNSGNPAEGLLFATAYTPGSGTAADGGHFLQSGTTPCQGVVIRNVAALCQNATAAVHAALFENCFSPDILGISTYFGTHGIVFKCIGGTASNLQAFGHASNGIIIKSNDYANCYRFNMSNFTIGSIGSFDGGGLILDANDAGSPGLYFCNITSGTINRTTFGIRTQGSVIDGNNISNIEVNVAQGNGVDILSGYAYGSLQNIKARSCGGIGFNIATTQSGITINDCDAHDNGSDGFRFTGVTNANFDNINAILNDGYGINVVSGNVYGGIRYTESNGSGATAGTIISKTSAQSLAQVTAIGATTSDAVSITGYNTSSYKFNVADIAVQPYGLNNGFITDNAFFNGSAWTRFNTGYSSKFQFYNGQIMLSNAATGSGSPTFIQGFKTDYNGHVGLGGNIDDVTYSGAKVYIDGSTGNMLINSLSDNGYKLQVNGAISTVTDSAASPKNMAWIDTDGKIRKAAVPSGGVTSINSMTGPAVTITAGTGITTSSASNDVIVAVDINNGSLPHTVDKQFIDANNTGTGETDLYTKSVAGNTLNSNGQSLSFEVGGVFNDATATANLQLYFAGTAFAGTGAMTISGTGAWRAQGSIVRVSSSVYRASVTFFSDNTTQKIFTSMANVTSVDFTTSNTFKITGQAGGAGGGSNDITAQMWIVTYNP